MSSIQGQRIEANCKIIWGGDSEYDLELETDDYEYYSIVVRKDHGDSFGAPLTMTNLCSSKDRAWAELDRMLGLWAAQVQSGQPMSKEQTLKLFGGDRGQHKRVLEQFLAEKERRGEN